MLELIRRLRGDNLFMVHASGVLLRNMREAGVAIPPATAQQVVSSMRAGYGPCVQVPTIPTRGTAGG